MKETLDLDVCSLLPTESSDWLQGLPASAETPYQLVQKPHDLGEY